MSTHSMDSHMNFRMSSEDKRIIAAAAKLKGLKPNTYARQKLLEVAEKDIAEMHPKNNLVLDEKSWTQFIAVMEAPVKINKKLKKAIQDFEQMNEL